MRVRVGEHRIWYAQRGAIDAPPIVTLHGFVISQRYMTPLAKRLASTRRVLSPDLPGFGRSSKPRHALDIDALADVVARWMEALGVLVANVVGNSMGCQVAMALAERHPERVASLVLIGPTTDAATRSVLRQAARLARDAMREPLRLPLMHVPDYLRCGPRRIAQTARFVVRDRIEERARRVPHRTLILRGERDALVSEWFVEHLASRMSDAEVVSIAGAAHAANYSAPDATASVIEAFLQGKKKEGARGPQEARAYELERAFVASRPIQ